MIKKISFSFYALLCAFTITSCSAVDSSNSRGSATPTSITNDVVGFWINEEASRTVVIQFSDSVVDVYEPQSLSRLTLTHSLTFDFEIEAWESQTCDCWLVTTPDESGNNQGSTGLSFNNTDHTEFEAYSDSGGFYLGGEFVQTDSTLFTYVGDTESSLSRYGVTLVH